MPFDRLAIVSVATSRDNDGILHDLHGDRAQELPHRFWFFHESLGSYPQRKKKLGRRLTESSGGRGMLGLQVAHKLPLVHVLSLCLIPM